MAHTNMSSNWQHCIIYYSHTFTSGPNKEMSGRKNGAVMNKLCQTSLISFNIFYWPIGFTNGGEAEDSDVNFIHCVPENILIKGTDKLGLEYISGPHNSIHVSQLKGCTETDLSELCYGSSPVHWKEGMIFNCELRRIFSTWKELTRSFSTWKIHLIRLEKWIEKMGCSFPRIVERATLSQA